MDPVGTQCHYCLKSANTWKQSKGCNSPITVAFQKWNCPLLPDFHLLLWLAHEDFTHTEEVADWMDGREVGGFSPSSWPSFGELGADESGVAISSISEYMEPPLAPFLMLNAFPKELRNYREIERKAENLKHTEVIHKYTKKCLFIHLKFINFHYCLTIQMWKKSYVIKNTIKKVLLHF